MQNNQISKLGDWVCVTQLAVQKALVSGNAEGRANVSGAADGSAAATRMVTSSEPSVFALPRPAPPRASPARGARAPPTDNEAAGSPFSPMSALRRPPGPHAARLCVRESTRRPQTPCRGPSSRVRPRGCPYCGQQGCAVRLLRYSLALSSQCKGLSYQASRGGTTSSGRRMPPPASAPTLPPLRS